MGPNTFMTCCGGWCEMLRDPSDRVHRALAENDLHRVLNTECGQVVAVGFFRGHTLDEER
jgi:hypothetical protein